MDRMGMLVHSEEEVGEVDMDPDSHRMDPYDQVSILLSHHLLILSTPLLHFTAQHPHPSDHPDQSAPPQAPTILPLPLPFTEPFQAESMLPLLHSIPHRTQTRLRATPETGTGANTTRQ
jgi:hypothetical protein